MDNQTAEIGTESLIEQMRPLLEANPQASLLLDSQGQIVLVNGSLETLFGHRRDEVIGEPVEILVAKPFRAEITELCESMLVEGRSVPGKGKEVVGLRRDGTEFSAELGMNPLPAGDDLLVICVFADVTGRVQAERDLADVEARYRSLVEALPLNVFQKDLEGRFKFVNRRMSQALRREPEQIVGKTDFDFFPREPAEKYRADDIKVATSGEVLEDIEEHVVATSGIRKYVYVLKAPVRDGQGRIVGTQGMFWDVSARRRAEQALDEVEATQKAIVEASLDCIITHDKEGRIIDFNTAAERTFGYRRDEAIGQDMAELLFPPLPRDRHRSNVDRFTRQREKGSLVGQRLEVPAVRKNGEEFVAEMALQPVTVGGETVFTVFLRDVTENHRAEEALRRSEERARRIVETAYDAYIAADADGVVTEWNEQSARMFGWSREEAVGKRLADIIIPPQHREDHTAGMARFRKTGEARILNERIEITALHRDKSEFPVELTVWPLETEGTTHFHAFIHDISERRQAEVAIQRANTRFRCLVDANIIGLMFTNFDGEITEANDAFLDIVGYTRDDLEAGEIWWNAMTPPEYRHLDERAVQQLQETGRCESWEKEYIRKDGRRVPVLLGVAMMEGDGAECLCYVIDMSAQKRAEAELQAAKELADRANQSKSVFLANVSHEIRTPMNAIVGMTEFLLDGELTPQQREYLTIIDHSAESLVVLINDVLDYSKIEAGRLELEEKEFRLTDCLSSTLKSLAVPAHQQSLELVSDIRADVPERVVGDQTRLRQILINLVGNAIKFTPGGEVVVSAEAVSRTADDVEIHFVVSDTGIGIPQDRQAQIFEAFEQVDSSMARKFGGTGLGLAICARLIELMGGRFWVESEVGQGSHFHFTSKLKIGEELAIDSGVGDSESVCGQRVLVVDDNASSRRALSETLRRWEMRPTAVANAESALQALSAAAGNGNEYGLILIDAHMPGTDGFELANELKKRSPQMMPQCIMLLHSGERTEDIAHCERLGMSACLLKPIDPSELFDTLVAVSGGESLISGIADPAERPGARLGPLDVLLVEDSLYNQKLAVGVLQNRGHQVTVVEDGKQAVSALERRQFDLVLMDVQMPVMDGLEATRIIRERERNTDRHVPIIAMTAQAMTGDRERCLEAGMDAYLSKPVRAAQMYDAIETVMPTRPASSQNVFGGDEDDESTAALDWSIALDATGGDRELLREVVEEFLLEYPRLLDQARAAIEAGDAQVVRRAAHSVKGALQTLGAESAGRCAERLELLGRAGTLDAAEESLEQLIGEMEEVLPEFERFVRKETRAGKG